MELASWDLLKERAGVPAPRVFPARNRLFGAKAAEFKFWHDAAGWCPSCAAVFMVLEEMKVPYVCATGPLSGYMKPGEQKPADFLKIRPNGVFPVLQYPRPGQVAQFDGEVVVHAFRILEFLKARYPDQACLPKTPVRRACADALGKLAEQLCYSTEGRQSRGEHIMDDVDAALGGGAIGNWGNEAERPWTKALENLRLQDDADGDETQFGGPLTSGPFLFGKKPCAVDLTFLPWLSQHQARLPDGAFEARWPAAGKMLAAAREPGICSCYDICYDKATLRGIGGRRLAENAPLPQVDIEALATQAASTPMSARRAAAGHICANHTAIARFARYGKGMWAAHREAMNAATDAEAAGQAMDLGMRMVSASLLFDQDADFTAAISLKGFAGQHAANIYRTCGKDASRTAGGALLFLSGNVGVPRDMEPGPADALRKHLALAAVTLGAGSDRATSSL